MAQVEVGGQKYYINKRNKRNWDSIKDGKLFKKNEDRVYIVDGRERGGKSTFAAQQACYIDPTLMNDASRITYSAKETLRAIRKTKSNSKETKVIWWDEAFRGMSSKSALTKENKQITQALMEMGENNLVLFLVSPSFFLLELYPAMLRSNTLFHIKKDKKTGKRYYRAFNYKQKAKLYQKGVRKGWNYNVPTPKRNKDWFFEAFPGGKTFRQKYLAKKRKAIRSTSKVDKEEKYNKDDTRFFIKKFTKNYIENNLDMKKKNLAKLFNISKPTFYKYEKKIIQKSSKK